MTTFKSLAIALVQDGCELEELVSVHDTLPKVVNRFSLCSLSLCG